MQTILVLITFCLAAGFLIKKFVWNPIYGKRKKAVGPLGSGHTDCGSCGGH